MNTQRRHMSMLRSYTPADALTIGNAACGTIAIFLCLDYIAADNRRFLWTAFLLLPLALVCDVLDGYVARLNRRRQSVLGADLDSLADVISFGVAPAVLGFTLGMRGGWDMLILTYFVICGVSRLARFNVTAAALSDSETGKVKYFEGTPIPTSIVIVLLLGVASYLGRIDDRLWFGAYQIGPALLHPHGARLRRERQRDDQRDAENSQTLTTIFSVSPRRHGVAEYARNKSISPRAALAGFAAAAAVAPKARRENTRTEIKTTTTRTSCISRSRVLASWPRSGQRSDGCPCLRAGISSCVRGFVVTSSRKFPRSSRWTSPCS